MNYAAQNQIESIVHALFEPMGTGGVYARTARFERVIDGLSGLISRYRAPQTEIFRFPPVMSRQQLERSGYLKSFPHLLGCVSCLHGQETEIRAIVDGSEGNQEWVSALSASELVLAPAACYPLYPIVAARGRLPESGLHFDVTCDCFRHESSYEAGRFQSFRMREYVCIGSPEHVVAFRRDWMERARELAELLAVPYQIASASDPFFGRAGKLMAVNQVEQELKFELLIPVNSQQNPTACMSFNYHRDHFGTIWNMETAASNAAHTACVAFGMDRLALALFATHGIDLQQWPGSVREALSL
ncbi:MAG: amino acid--[acyl-carrier-protein] ligase [Xanthobacteraceae bacterium]|jgi:seryl-tRNA synthetase